MSNAAFRVGVIGSSAGGLLATGAVLSIEPRPDRMPEPLFHIQSCGLADLSLLPEPAVSGLLEESAHLAWELSPVNHVSPRTASTFVWATAQDGPGLPNALAWTQALAAHEVPVELHIFPEGPHGVGLADGTPYGAHGHRAIAHTAQRTTACRRWLEWTFQASGPSPPMIPAQGRSGAGIEVRRRE